jgi:hypothetical protein
MTPTSPNSRFTSSPTRGLRRFASRASSVTAVSAPTRSSDAIAIVDSVASSSQVVICAYTSYTPGARSKVALPSESLQAK